MGMSFEPDIIILTEKVIQFASMKVSVVNEIVGYDVMKVQLMSNSNSNYFIAL